MPRNKAEDARRARESRARWRARVAAGDPVALARRDQNSAKAREYERAQRARLRAAPQTWEDAKARRREYERAAYAARREREREFPPSAEVIEGRRVRQRERNERWRRKQKALVATGDGAALAARERRRQQSRDSYRRRAVDVTARKRRLYASDPTKMLASSRASYAKNKARWKPTRLEWYLAHRDEVNARQRERARREYDEDPKRINDYMRRWREKNPELARSYIRRSSAARRGAIGNDRIAVSDWLELLEHWELRCAYCGSPGSLHMDHRTPLKRGGRHLIENVLPACPPCNLRKHDKTEEEFRAYMSRIVCWLTIGAERRRRSDSG